jgi:hypothetical protein
MFGVLESLAKATVAVAVTPIAVVADVVTLGGELVDKRTSFTGDALNAAAENIGKAIDPRK